MFDQYTEMMTRPNNFSLCFRRFIACTILLLLIGVGDLFAMADKDKNCIECHPKFKVKLSGKFNHKPFQENKCKSCHKSHGMSNDIQFNGLIIDICSNCHSTAEELPFENLHYPLTDEPYCITCHNPHGAENRQLLRAPVGELCIECHDAPSDYEGNLHPPFADQNCVACHNPHGSIFDHNLQMPAGYLCLSCHESIGNDIEPSDFHAAKEMASCERCHSGHASTSPSLLKKDVEKLCISCHTTIKQQIEDGKQHSLLDDENCVVCHTPHFKKGASSLETEVPDLCLECHSGIEEALALDFPHPAAEEDCENCHSPHVQLTKADQPDICTACHDIEDKSFSDLHQGIEPKFCSNCHNPHGSSQEKIIRENEHPPFSDRECDACHEAGQSRQELRDPELCFTCHDTPDPTGAHKPQNNNALVCVSCHSPHAAAGSPLLKALR